MSGKPGQGRKFHLEDALEAAMIVFWAHGYEGSSMAELTRAMGIKAPSLYKAYGSKEDLFFSVVDHYNSTHGSFMSSAMAEEKDGLAMLRRILLEAAQSNTLADVLSLARRFRSPLPMNMLHKGLPA